MAQYYGIANILTVAQLTFRTSVTEGCQCYPIQSNGSFGSNYDLQHRLVLRLECDGEPTFAPERRLCGGDRT